jgi:hypothetical protein
MAKLPPAELNVEVKLAEACSVCSRGPAEDEEHDMVPLKSVIKQAGGSIYFDVLVPWAHGGCLN